MVTSALAHKRRRKHFRRTHGCATTTPLLSPQESALKPGNKNCRFQIKVKSHRREVDGCGTLTIKVCSGYKHQGAAGAETRGSLRQICMKRASTSQPVSLSTHAAPAVQRGQSCLMN